MDWLKSSYIQLLALLATAMAAALFYPQFSLNHDSSWYLVGTRMFLEGERLYVGVVEINPPLAFYLTVPPIVFAGLTGLSDTLSFMMYVLALCCGSSLWLMRVLRHSNLEEKVQSLLFCVGLFGLFVLPMGDFGQREHLMLIFAMPYLYHLVLGDEVAGLSVPERFVLGLVSTLGLGLKPHFLLLPALIYLAGPVRSLTQRILHPENIGLGLGLASYAAFIAIAHLEYLTHIIPTAQRVYASYGTGWQGVLFRFEFVTMPFLCLLIGLYSRSVSIISARLLLAITASLTMYIIQFKGWNYQIIPFSFFMTLGSCWIFSENKFFIRRAIVPGLMTVVILFFAVYRQIERGPYEARTTKAFSPFLQRRGQTILVLSANLPPAFPFINEVQGQWSSRFPAQWHIPGALVGKKKADCRINHKYCKELDNILDEARASIVEDILRYNPELVFVDKSMYKSYFEDIKFEYLDFLGSDPRFSRVWSHYKLQGKVRGFEVWSRTAPGARHHLSLDPSSPSPRPSITLDATP